MALSNLLSRRFLLKAAALAAAASAGLKSTPANAGNELSDSRAEPEALSVRAQWLIDQWTSPRPASAYSFSDGRYGFVSFFKYAQSSARLYGHQLPDFLGLLSPVWESRASPAQALFLMQNFAKSNFFLRAL